ncbi:MAG TPA: GntR family transcriptional regulator [Beijerinckiaceae bacterium]|nr:GntR family transcriptional regulator [Beijerinckiaceae bacterium]
MQSAALDTPVDPEPRGRATAVAVARLRDCIVQGELAPGARVPERALCERLGLSRTPLREALKVLEAEGLVDIAPHRGAVVRRLSLDEVEATIEVLVALEGAAAERAARRITEAEIAAIAALHARMAEHHRAGDLLDYFHVNQAIHEAIVDAAGNPVLSRLYRAESGRIRRYRYAGNLQHPRWDRALREHAQILDALAARDGALLRELMRAHMIAGWRIVRGLYADELSGRTS